MFNLEITLEQKRWGYIPEPDAAVEFHTRTEITELSIEDATELQGSVTVQKEMMLSAFPTGQSLVFKDGVLQDLYRASVKPYTMKKEVDLGSNAAAVFIATNDTAEVSEAVADVFTRPCMISLSNFTALGFDWEAVIYDSEGGVISTFDGTNIYGRDFLVQGDEDSTGIQLNVSEPDDFSVLSDTDVSFTNSSKILINGVWMPESFEDEGDDHGFDVTLVGTDVVFAFIGGYSLTIPQSVFESGDWYELPDPTDETEPYSEKSKSGISVRFGFVEGEAVDFSADLTPVFYGQLLSSEDAVTEFEDTFVFRRVMDICDLRGSLGRYDDLSTFYKARRWVKEETGVPRFYYLKETAVEDVYAWALFTGTVNTDNEPDLRASTAKESYSDVERADEEAVATVNMVRIFKSQYTDFVNTSFSTDTDEYPDKKQVIVI